MVIGLDIDGVVAYISKHFIPYFNQVTKSNFGILKPGNTISYEDYLKHPETDNIFKEFILSGGLENLEPIEGAIEGIKELQKKHKIIFVSSRGYVPNGFNKEEIENKWNQTINWFKKYDINPILIFTPNKEKIIVSYGINIFLDDLLSTCKKISKITRKCKLVWFSNEKSNEFETVKSWNEFLNLMRRIK